MPDVISIYTLLKDIFFTIEDGDRLFFQQFDLTVTRFYALYHLNAHPGLTLRELADRMLCDKSNVTRVVKGLERDHLIYRKDHETDGRAYRLYLHNTGRERLEQVSQQHETYNHKRFDNQLSRREYEQLEQTLKKLKGELIAKLQT